MFLVRCDRRCKSAIMSPYQQMRLHNYILRGVEFAQNEIQFTLLKWFVDQLFLFIFWFGFSNILPVFQYKNRNEMNVTIFQLLLSIFFSTGGILDKRQHQTNASLEKMNDLTCYQCSTMNDEEKCRNKTFLTTATSNTKFQQKCKGDKKTCMVILI